WQSGRRSAVFFTPSRPAAFPMVNTSPLGTVPLRMAAMVSGELVRTMAWAVASRRVFTLCVMSIMVHVPSAGAGSMRGCRLAVGFPLVPALGEEFLAEDGQTLLDPFHQEAAGLEGRLPVRCGDKDGEADPSYGHRAQGMVYMHAGELEAGEGFLADLGHHRVGHLLMRRVINGRHRGASDAVRAHLAEKDVVRADIRLVLVVGDGDGQLLGRDRALDEDVPGLCGAHGLRGCLRVGAELPGRSHRASSGAGR